MNKYSIHSNKPKWFHPIINEPLMISNQLLSNIVCCSQIWWFWRSIATRSSTANMVRSMINFCLTIGTFSAALELLLSSTHLDGFSIWFHQLLQIVIVFVDLNDIIHFIFVWSGFGHFGVFIGHIEIILLLLITFAISK